MGGLLLGVATGPRWQVSSGPIQAARRHGFTLTIADHFHTWHLRYVAARGQTRAAVSWLLKVQLCPPNDMLIIRSGPARAAAVLHTLADITVRWGGADMVCPTQGHVLLAPRPFSWFSACFLPSRIFKDGYNATNSDTFQNHLSTTTWSPAFRLQFDL